MELWRGIKCQMGDWKWEWDLRNSFWKLLPNADRATLQIYLESFFNSMSSETGVFWSWFKTYIYIYDFDNKRKCYSLVEVICIKGSVQKSETPCICYRRFRNRVWCSRNTAMFQEQQHQEFSSKLVHTPENKINWRFPRAAGPPIQHSLSHKRFSLNPLKFRIGVF